MLYELLYELDRRLARPAHALPGARQRHDARRARLRADVHGRPDGEGPRAGRAARGRARPRGASRWPRRWRSTGARRQRATARSTTRRWRSRPAARSCERGRSSSCSSSCAAELAVQRVTVRVDVPGAVVPRALRGARARHRQPARRHDGPDASSPCRACSPSSGGQVVQEDAAAAFPGDRRSTRCASATAACARRS